MRASAVVFGAVTIGLVVSVVWHSWPSNQTRYEPKPVVDSFSSESKRGVSRSQEAAVSERRAPVAPATLPDETPAARLIEQVPRGPEEGELVFSAERVDATWAPGAEADILGRFARANGLALITLQVECKSTMCKVQVASPEESSGGGTFEFLNGSLGLKPRWVTRAVDRSGMLQWVAYVGREAMDPSYTDPIFAPTR